MYKSQSARERSQLSVITSVRGCFGSPNSGPTWPIWGPYGMLVLYLQCGGDGVEAGKQVLGGSQQVSHENCGVDGAGRGVAQGGQ